ncbi:hypothetical protein [Blastococcus mobilis]|uniref:Uncharacterized protein n=1 Tax=Blastococcus mobilis TaxID=1938746 RepID=A0A239AIH4_9ACTN|nr:hypothetical protein [Blastococcus mobilis]SNR95445.1 hypothetical protein SAMN06272737_14613 [Blastococcus mobilis]
MTPQARELIAAVEQLQAGRAWLGSLLAEVADTAADAGPDMGAVVALPADLLAEIRAALAASP